MNNILVIGGAGYIGSHVVLKLKKQGYNPIILDNLSTGNKESVKNSVLYISELDNEETITTIIKKYNINCVMHFAAFIEVGESVLNPIKYYYNNVVKVFNLLNILIKNNIKYFVFSSTAATFGEPKKEKIDEMHYQMPINTYGNTKLCVEKMLQDFEKSLRF